MKILHILPRFIGGGPERHILALAALWAEAGYHTEHMLAVLEPPLSAPLIVKARKAGIRIIPPRDGDALAAALEAADIVSIQFWNHPLLYAWLREELPAMRVAVKAAVSGLAPPQSLPEELGLFADAMQLTSSGEASPAARAARAAGRNIIVCPALADMSRLDGFAPRPHGGIRVGYFGLVEPTKMHPRFAALCAAVGPGIATFDVFGDGSWGSELARQFTALGARDRVRLHGHAEDLHEVFAEMDIFGYPLARDSYASSDKTIQEAMWAGVPPVVLAGTGISALVEHERTGLVCASEADYPRAIERLALDPALRLRLGSAARSHARSCFDPVRNAAGLRRHFEETARLPKRRREPLPGRGLTAAARFVASLGDQAGAFAPSLGGPPGTSRQDVLAADAVIAGSSAVLAHGEGGIIHHRNTHPDDPTLRFWSGLVARHDGDRATAEAEFEAAVAMGFPRWRIPQREASP